MSALCGVAQHASSVLDAAACASRMTALPPVSSLTVQWRSLWARPDAMAVSRRKGRCSRSLLHSLVFDWLAEGCA